jgi:hypothetical protein
MVSDSSVVGITRQIVTHVRQRGTMSSRSSRRALVAIAGTTVAALSIGLVSTTATAAGLPTDTSSFFNFPVAASNPGTPQNRSGLNVRNASLSKQDMKRAGGTAQRIQTAEYVNEPRDTFRGTVVSYKQPKGGGPVLVAATASGSMRTQKAARKEITAASPAAASHVFTYKKKSKLGRSVSTIQLPDDGTGNILSGKVVTLTDHKKLVGVIVFATPGFEKQAKKFGVKAAKILAKKSGMRTL